MGKPVYETDLSKPMSELIEGWRSQLAKIRGQIDDAGHEWSSWQSHLKHIEGLMTCGIVCLHNTRELAKDCESKWGDDYLQKASATKAMTKAEGDDNG